MSEEGADAGEKWKKGKPIRVIRTEKGKKHSKFAPDVGCRYDGLYKVTFKTIFITSNFLIMLLTRLLDIGVKRVRRDSAFGDIFSEGMIPTLRPGPRKARKSSARKVNHLMTI